FGIFASTTLEWALFDFALASIGAIAAPLYANSSTRDCAYLLSHSEAIGVLAESDEQLAKIVAARAETPELAHIIAFADLPDLERRGREHASLHAGALAEAGAAISEEDLYTYIFTSGTTGPPKACLIRHRNSYEMAAIVHALNTFTVPGDVMLLYLPLAHNF